MSKIPSFENWLKSNQGQGGGYPAPAPAPAKNSFVQPQRRAEIPSFSDWLSNKKSYSTNTSIPATDSITGSLGYAMGRRKRESLDTPQMPTMPEPLSSGQKRWEAIKGSGVQGLGSFNEGVAKFGNMLFGKDSLIGGLTNELRVMLGITGQDIGEGIKDAGAEKAGNAIQDFGEKVARYDKNAAEELNNYYKTVNEINQRYYAERTQGDKLAEGINKYGSQVVAALPDLALAYMSAGTSTAAQAGTKGLQAASAIGQSQGIKQLGLMAKQSLEKMARDPNFASSFIQTSGSSYEEALNEGASQEEALTYGIINGLMGASIEVGGGDEALGGMQKLPQNVQQALKEGNTAVFWNYIKSIGSEVGEELTQGAVERGLKPLYGKETSLIGDGTKGENAIIDPKQMAEEAKGAAIVSAILGAPATTGQVIATKASERAKLRNDAKHSLDATLNEVVEEAPAPTEAPAPVQKSEAQITIEEILSGTVSNSKAEKILGDAELRQAFLELAVDPDGKPIELKGTKSEQRKLIKDAKLKEETESAATEVLKSQEGLQKQESINTPPVAETRQEASESVEAEAKDPAKFILPERKAPPSLDEDFTIKAEDRIILPDPEEKIDEESLPEDATIRERGGSWNTRTNDYMEESLKQGYEDDPLFYVQNKNEDLKGKAMEIFAKETDHGRVKLEGMIEAAKGGAKLKLEAVPLAKLVANDLAQKAKALQMEGKTEEAARLRGEARNFLSDIAVELTYAGQLGQANRILRYTGSEGRLLAIKKTVERLNNKLNLKDNIELSQELIDRYEATEDADEQNTIIGEMEQSIADQIPASIMEKINALRYLNMLGNFKTQLRNLAGNTISYTATKLSNTLSAIGEEIYALQNPDFEKTKSLNISKELKGEALKDYENVKDEVSGEGKYKDESRAIQKNIQDRRRIFKSGFMEGYRNLTNWAMDAGDAIFGKRAYANALAGWLDAHGYDSISSVDEETLGRARAYAIEEAQKVTFRDNSQFAEALSKLRYNGDNAVLRGFSKVGEAILPFRKTPANVMVRAYEFSPLGLLSTASKGWKLKNGKADVTADQFISSLSKNLTGSGIMALGWLLASIGRANGAEEDKELRSFQNQQGKLDWSIDLNGDGDWTTLDWASPVAIPFFMGVQMQQNSEGGMSLESFLGMAQAMGDVALDMSMLSGVNDALSNISKFGDSPDALPQFLMNAGASYATQIFQNSILRQLEYVSQPNRMQSYTDPDSSVSPFLQRPIARMSTGIPGWDYNQAEYIDAWGRKQSNGHVEERVWRNMFSPWYKGKNAKTGADEELERIYKLGVEQGDKEMSSVLPQRPKRSMKIDDIRLNEKEYEAYATTLGQESLKLVDDFIKSAQWKGISDRERAAVINKLYTLAEEKARNELRRSRGVKDIKTSVAGEMKGRDATEYFIFNEAWDSRVEKGEYSKLDALVPRYQKLPEAAKEALPSSVEAFMDFNEKGVGAEDYFTVKEEVSKETEKQGSSSAWVKMSGVANADLEDEIIDIFAEEYLGSRQIKDYRRARKSGADPEDIIARYASEYLAEKARKNK